MTVPSNLDMLSPNKLAVECDDYLASRTATFEQRCDRYSAALGVMKTHGGLSDDDILLDFGAGSTDLDRYLRGNHWGGRYWPMDGWMGHDLQCWEPKRPVQWVVALEIIEHFPKPIAMQVLERFKVWATKGVVLTTPNKHTVDVLAMDETHLWEPVLYDLRSHGYTATTASLYGQPEDSLLAWWTP